MKISIETSAGANAIRSYAVGQITVNDETISRSVIVMPERLIRDWPPQRFEELAAEHFLMLAALRPEIVLLGTGRSLRFPHPARTALLLEQGIGVEVMDTAAACRTYNVLTAEGRVVAAALLMI
jgi:uncharacterized protein